MRCRLCVFFFNDTATTEIYTLSLHDALPIFLVQQRQVVHRTDGVRVIGPRLPAAAFQGLPVQRLRLTIAALGLVRDRKSTRLNSSHANISYAVFCLKKKKNTTLILITKQTRK